MSYEKKIVCIHFFVYGGYTFTTIRSYVNLSIEFSIKMCTSLPLNSYNFHNDILI